MELEYEPYPGDQDLEPANLTAGQVAKEVRPQSTGFTVSISAVILIVTVAGLGVTFFLPIIVGMFLFLIGPIMGIVFLARQRRQREEQMKLVASEFLPPQARLNAAKFATFSQAFVLLSSIGLALSGIWLLFQFLGDYLPGDSWIISPLLGAFTIPTLGVFALAAGSVWYSNTDILAGEAYALVTGEGKPGLIKFTRVLNQIVIWGYLLAVAGILLWWAISAVGN